MRSAFALSLILPCIYFNACNPDKTTAHFHKKSTSSFTQPNFDNTAKMQHISQIPLPPGYVRARLQPNTFSSWIRDLPLKKPNIVYLFNGEAKANQYDHYAVVDISTGTRNLQQCADALMRLRAEYLYSIKAHDKIEFVTGDAKVLSFTKYARGERYVLVGQQLAFRNNSVLSPSYNHKCLLQYLNNVFNYCSTYSLPLMCKPKQLSAGVLPGDMFVKAGSPGHAMMVADVAWDVYSGKRIYLLIQGFMPAQDIHIVRNPSDAALSPWYEENDHAPIITPGWTFKPTDLRKW